MHTYIIKEDGVTIGQALGKKKAVEFVKKQLVWYGSPDRIEKWERIAGDIRVGAFEIVRQN